MKLFYFNVKGRPEPAKLCLRLAGIQFEDIQFDPAAWASEYKALSPSGQVRALLYCWNPDSMHLRDMVASKT
jgi:glutathione S-transferase